LILPVALLKDIPADGMAGMTWSKGLGSVVVLVMVVMMMAGGKSGRAGKHHQKQNSSENPFHGWHPSKIRFAAKAHWQGLVSKGKLAGLEASASADGGVLSCLTYRTQIR